MPIGAEPTWFPQVLGQPELHRTLSLNKQMSKLITSCAQEMPVFPRPGFIFKRSLSWSGFHHVQIQVVCTRGFDFPIYWHCWYKGLLLVPKFKGFPQGTAGDKQCSVWVTSGLHL